MTTAVDPISFEVIRNALVAATDEMVLALKRSAYSTNIKTRSDFSCAFFDAELRSVAQGFAQPVHLGSMVEQVPQAIRRYGARAENEAQGVTAQGSAVFQTAAIACSIPVRGACLRPRARAPATGSGSSWQTISPAALRGRESAGITNDGTM